MKERRMLSSSMAAVFAAAIATFVPLFTMPLNADIWQKPKIAASCKQCHKPDENILRGLFTGISNKANIVQMKIGQAVWLVKYDGFTKLIGAEKWTKIPKEKEIAIATMQKDGDLYAVSVTLKPPVKVAPEKVASIDDVARLIAQGPGKAYFELVDSRPLVQYNEGHIPGAIPVPEREFNKFAGLLPKEKDRLLIFYCSGPAGRLSLSAAAKAEKSGYTRVKIFTDGLFGWEKAGNLVLSSGQNYKEYLEKGSPVVLIDLRPMDEAKGGHIIGAVSITGKDIPNARERFPSDKSAPIILYDNDTKGATDDFVNVRGWGYINVSVLEGGFEEWKRSGGLVINGDVATKLVYVPKLRPGEISIDEFKRIAETSEPEKLVLDVRDEHEAVQGMLKVALNMPIGYIKGRLTDIPRNKEVIVYSDTGVEAEMAYHILKEAGYKTRFLNAVIKIEKDGKFTISKE